MLHPNKIIKGKEGAWG